MGIAQRCVRKQRQQEGSPCGGSFPNTLLLCLWGIAMATFSTELCQLYAIGSPVNKKTKAIHQP